MNIYPIALMQVFVFVLVPHPLFTSELFYELIIKRFAFENLGHQFN